MNVRHRTASGGAIPALAQGLRQTPPGWQGGPGQVVLLSFVTESTQGK